MEKSWTRIESHLKRILYTCNHSLSEMSRGTGRHLRHLSLMDGRDGKSPYERESCIPNDDASVSACHTIKHTRQTVCIRNSTWSTSEVDSIGAKSCRAHSIKMSTSHLFDFMFLNEKQSVNQWTMNGLEWCVTLAWTSLVEPNHGWDGQSSEAWLDGSPGTRESRKAPSEGAFLVVS